VAGGEYHRPGGVEGLIAGHDPPGAVEVRPGAYEPAALGGEPVHGGGVVPVGGGLVTDAPGHRLPGRVGGGVPCHAVDSAGFGQQVGGADHHLAGHASPVWAFAADQVGLDADHGQAGFGQPASYRLAGHSHADHYGVDVFSHC
jgi:hypothetical protein